MRGQLISLKNWFRKGGIFREELCLQIEQQKPQDLEQLYRLARTLRPSVSNDLLAGSSKSRAAG